LSFLEEQLSGDDEKGHLGNKPDEHFFFSLLVPRWLGGNQGDSFSAEKLTLRGRRQI
jgi:hypothetical protein